MTSLPCAARMYGADANQDCPRCKRRSGNRQRRARQRTTPYESRWRFHSAVKRGRSRTRSVAMTSAAGAACVSATPSSLRRWLVGASTGHAGVVAASLRRRQSRRRVRPCCLRDGACRPAGLRLAHRPVPDLATSRARVGGSGAGPAFALARACHPGIALVSAKDVRTASLRGEATGRR